MRILLVEDDQMLGKAVKNALELNYNNIDWVCDHDSCNFALKTTDFDLILLDLNLPNFSGLEILKNLRSVKNKTPVIILTAMDSTRQKIEGLDLGADDYITKPFDLEELLARIRSISRRVNETTSCIVEYKDVKLDTAAHSVLKGEQKIELSPKEFMILQILMENQKKVVSKSRLENSLYNWDNSIESNTVEVHIHHIRKKIGQDLIKTVRGIGYSID